jgi:hypothetical protein
VLSLWGRQTIGGGHVATAPDVRMVAASSLCCAGRSQRLVSGRARQLAVLREKRQRSTYGELRVALVLSDPGLGQTWLAPELVPHSAEFPVALLAHRGQAASPTEDAMGYSK